MLGSKLKPSNQLGRLFAELCGAWNLKPYWGKPTVRNFRGGGWKRDHGSRTEAHVERRGTATGPYRARQCSTRQHGGCIETRGRVHETKTDSKTRSTESGDGIHVSGLLQGRAS